MFCKQNNIFMLKDNCKNKVWVECLFYSVRSLFKNLHDKMTKCLGAAKTSFLAVNFINILHWSDRQFQKKFFFEVIIPLKDDWIHKFKYIKSNHYFLHKYKIFEICLEIFLKKKIYEVMNWS